MTDVPEEVAAVVRALVSSSSLIECIEVSKKSAVYRVWRGGTHSPVIVKRCATGLGVVERFMYDELLPTIGVEHLELYETTTDQNGAIWLVMEDAGIRRPDLATVTHRRLLTEWVGRLHAATRHISRPLVLPDRGLSYFRARLMQCTRELEMRCDQEGNDLDANATMQRAMESCRRLEFAWPHLTLACEPFASCVVHGDLATENLRIEVAPSGDRLLVLDWEKSGWGVPAIDMLYVEPSSYALSMVKTRGATQASIEQLRLVGRFFRLLDHQWTTKSLGKLERGERRFSNLLLESGW